MSILYWNIPTDWLFCTGISLLTWLTILYWNIPTDWIFYTGMSLLAGFFVLEYSTDWIFCTGVYLLTEYCVHWLIPIGGSFLLPFSSWLTFSHWKFSADLKLSYWKFCTDCQCSFENPLLTWKALTESSLPTVKFSCRHFCTKEGGKEGRKVKEGRWKKEGRKVKEAYYSNVWQVPLAACLKEGRKG